MQTYIIILNLKIMNFLYYLKKTKLVSKNIFLFLIIFLTTIFFFTEIYSHELRLENQSWYYQKGFHKDYLKLSIDEIDNKWKKKKLPIRFKKITPPETSKNNLKQMAEFTIATTFDYRTRNEIPPIGLHIPLIGDQYRIYLNGFLIQDEIPKEIQSSNNNYISRKRRNLILYLPYEHIQDKNNILLFHIKGNPIDETVGLFNKTNYEINTLENLKHKHTEIFNFTLTLTYFILGLYHILLFIKRRKDKYNFYFGTFSVVLSFYLFMRSSIALELFENSHTANRLEYISLFYIFPFILGFMNQLFYSKLSRFTGILFIFYFVLSIPVALMPMVWNYQIIYLWQISGIVLMIYSFYYLTKALLKKKKEAIPLFGGFLAVALGGIYDIINSMFYHYDIVVTRYTFFLAVIGITVLLANRFLMVHKKAEELTSLLEKKVRNKTNELTEALFNVNKLKEKQDGDYFLTSLLIEPLAKFKSNDTPVFYREHIEQKTNFYFKNRKVEIGGDIIITDTVKLKQREYSVFLNGDAMGKSIQGAGGALILGVVFNSYLDRTHFSHQYSDKEPERWIRDCYFDMQNVFESFDGSMLISIVMGLIDKKNGAMYYINAEHPWTVLYRGKKATFLETELSLRKVGMSIQTDRFQIKTFLLQPRDILFVGSDGKDDILFNETDDSLLKISSMNEDETLFLKHVEYASADLNRIVNQLHDSGKIIDDLTLLKIEYNPEKEDKPAMVTEIIEMIKNLHQQKKWEEILRKIPKNWKKIKIPRKTQYHLMNAAVRLKRYQKAIEMGNFFTKENPIHNKILFLLFYSMKKTGNFQKAIELGEKIRLRDPYNNINLLQLADVYRHIHHPQRAQQLIHDILETDPENEKAHILQKHL